MAGMSEQPLVTRHDDDRVAIITLDSPHNRNALSRRLVAELRAHLDAVAEDAVAEDATLHAVLLRSSQRVFCAGADLREAAIVDMRESARGIIALQRAIAACPVPVVVALEGPVRAGGLGLVASADIVLCADDVTFALTEVRLGLAAAVISVPLLHRLTPRVAADWFLTGREITADQAREGGLVTAVHPPDDLTRAVDVVLADLRRGLPQGLREAKRLLAADLVAAFDERGDDLADLSGQLFHSEVAQQAMAAALRRG